MQHVDEERVDLAPEHGSGDDDLTVAGDDLQIDLLPRLERLHELEARSFRGQVDDADGLAIGECGKRWVEEEAGNGAVVDSHGLFCIVAAVKGT